MSLHPEIQHSFRDALCGWREIDKADLHAWTQELFRASAPLFQMPYWAESLRRVHFHPKYLAWTGLNGEQAYVNILTAGLWPCRIGLIQRGPVPLAPLSDLTDRCILGLARWARRRGYVFLRFSHSNPNVLQRIADLWPSQRSDPFPFYSDATEELIVSLKSNRDDQLAGFDREARRKIRNASRIPYEIEVSTSPDRLRQVWHLYQELAARKGFFHRPFSSYLDLMTGAKNFEAARLYVVSLHQKPVNSLFQVNDVTTAFYMSGALDVAALQGSPTPAFLLVSKVMEDAARAGLKFFHFGSKSGKVHRFKSQFCPVEYTLPAPVTLVLNRLLYRGWTLGLLPLAPRLKRIIKRRLADPAECED